MLAGCGETSHPAWRLLRGTDEGRRDAQVVEEQPSWRVYHGVVVPARRVREYVSRI